MKTSTTPEDSSAVQNSANPADSGVDDRRLVRLEDCRENFRDDGDAFVVRCPSCKRENHAMIVATGGCGWCGWEDAPQKSCMDDLTGKISAAGLYDPETNSQDQVQQ